MADVDAGGFVPRDVPCTVRHVSKVFAATFNRVLLYAGHPDIFRRIAANRLGDRNPSRGKKWAPNLRRDIYFNGVEKKTIVSSSSSSSRGGAECVGICSRLGFLPPAKIGVGNLSAFE